MDMQWCFDFYWCVSVVWWVWNKPPSPCEDLELYSPSLGPRCWKLAGPLRCARELNSMQNLWMMQGNFFFIINLNIYPLRFLYMVQLRYRAWKLSFKHLFEAFATWSIIIWVCIQRSFEQHGHIIRHQMCQICVYMQQKQWNESTSNFARPPCLSRSFQTSFVMCMMSETVSCGNCCHLHLCLLLKIKSVCFKTVVFKGNSKYYGVLSLGFKTSNPRVGFSHTVPEPVYTVTRNG